jgi:KDO2-lipid IV(A) lauroyltransferase
MCFDLLIMNIRNQIEYSATLLLLGLCKILPERLVYGLFHSIARGMYLLLKSRRKLTLRNMEIAFPEKSDEERKQLAKKSFLNMADSMAFTTFIMSGRISNERLIDCVEAEGWENLEQAASSTKQGILAFTAHIGNWELMPQYAALRLGKPLHVIARKGSNPLLEEKVVRPLRERFGVNVFYKRNAMMRIMKVVKKGEIAGILVDQRLNQGISVNFFGREAGTTPTPALLQIRYNVTTLPVFMVKVERGKYRLIIGKPVEWADNGKPMEDQVRELTCIHQKIVEDTIREYPDQWFWMHNRWGIPKAER